MTFKKHPNGSVTIEVPANAVPAMSDAFIMAAAAYRAKAAEVYQADTSLKRSCTRSATRVSRWAADLLVPTPPFQKKL